MISTSFRVLQVNLNRNSTATESALQVAVELKVDLIVVQEPWTTTNVDHSFIRSILHPSFTQLLPTDVTLRPRTLVYVARGFRPTVAISDCPSDPDLLVINIIEGKSQIQLLNVYHEENQLGHGPKTIERLFNRQILPNTLLLGDFNTHHPWWDPFAKPSAGAHELVDWFENNDLALINTPGTGTYFRPGLIRESVLDLTLATSSLASRILDWQVLPDLGSDHFGILFTVAGTRPNLVDNPTQQTRFNTALANWDLFATSLKANIVNSLLINSTEFLELETKEQSLVLLQHQNRSLVSLLDTVALELTNAIQYAAQSSIPTSTPGARPKPWWNPDLLALRKTMLRNQRALGASPESKLRYLQSKNAYFLAIKQAKRNHWNQFLEKEDPQSIFKAMSYTKDRLVERIPAIQGQSSFNGQCDAFRSTLFPPPPTAPEPSWVNYETGGWKWEPLTTSELNRACSAKIKGKTPGPDMISQEIITHAYHAIPDVFFKLYSSLLDIGYHPKCWKQATGAILKKAAKRDYSVPKAYRVISLLNCLGKVSERILAQRLGYLAETTTLLHPSQIGGRLHKSAIDAALLLTTEIQSNKKRNLKTSTLLLDVKGAFDHVAKNQLLAILHKLRLPTSLISWVSSFLSDRFLGLSFNGQIEQSTSINTGIPQGSPISPILFLIYIRDLFPTLAVRVLSYIDDITLSTSSTSLKKNIRILEREAAKIYALGANNAIQFDLEKTELIHFTTSKEAKTASLRLPNDEIVYPQEVVRWLGVWFDQGLTFKQHVAIRISQAKSAFFRMTRLANSERGLTPFAMRQLYLACVTSVADYGCQIWWRGQAQFKRPLQALQNLGLRKILGVFKTAPTIPMEVEAALPPPSVRLSTSIRKYAFRALKLSPNHPINRELKSITTTTTTTTTTPVRPQPRVNRQPTQLSAKKQPTQLERIQRSIHGLVDSDSLERIQHFKYPPWNRTTPYSVSISQLPKDDAALAHNLSQQQVGANDVTIYTDASAMSDEKSIGVGVGLVVFKHRSITPRIVYRSMSNLGHSQLVYNGELEGTTQAIEYASLVAQPGQHFHIFSDNQAGLYRLKTPSDHPGQSCQIRASTATELIRRKGAKVSLNWVPGHTDVVGNELADSLAKEATTLTPESDETSFAALGCKINELRTVEWNALLDQYDQIPNTNTTSYKKHFSWKLGSKLQLPTGTRRELASAFYQLKLGHGYLKSYLFRLGHSDSDRCRCGQKETSEHLLLSCRKLQVARAKLLDELNCTRLSLRVLLHTKTGIEKTLAFLRETRIVTRKWHLERTREEEEEWDRAWN